MRIKRIWIQLLVWRCRAIHWQHHVEIWFDFSKLFYKCSKCGCGFATDRLSKSRTIPNEQAKRRAMWAKIVRKR